MEKDAIWNSTQLMQVSVDLSVYRYTIAYALGNLIIMTIMSSGFILFEFLEQDFLMIILFWITLSFLAVMVHVYVFRFAFKIVRLGLWFLVYPAVFTFGYGINSILNNVISINLLWYPLIGLSNLIIGLSIEKQHYLTNKLFSRPVFTLGIVLLISFPFIWLITEFLIISQSLKFVIGPGLALILTSLSTSYSMAQAEKQVKNK
ncbi:MAG: hypothetical protein ACW981_00585 [Candidatus Hodarchaeales archaeon]